MEDEENQGQEDDSKVEKGREELRKQLSGHSGRVNRYKDYYNANKGDLIENLLINFENSKKPATAGLIVLAPVIVVLFIVDWVLEKISSLPFVDLLNLTGYTLIDEVVKLIFLISFGAFLATAVGRLVRTEKGFRVEKILDDLMEKIPFLGSIYSISKVTADTVFNGAEEFSDPVKLELNGLMVTAYRTGNSGEDGREVLFVPTSPNVTTGFVVEAEEGEIIETDDTAREALTRTLSAGFGDSNRNKPRRKPVEDGDKNPEDNSS